MSATNASDPISKSAAKKKRKNKKKANDKNKDSSDAVATNGARDDAEADEEEGEADEDAQHHSDRQSSIVESAPEQTSQSDALPDALPDSSRQASDLLENTIEVPEQTPEIPHQASEPAETLPEPIEHDSAPSASVELQETDHAPSETTLPLRNGVHGPDNTETAARLEAMAKERDDLRAEVIELRKSLETIQGKHQEDLSGLREEVEEAQSAKENAEGQYRTLLGKVNTIRSQLGERLKADAEELSQARTQIEDLQEDNRSTKEANEELRAKIEKLETEAKEQGDEVASLRNRTNLSQTNWAKERDELIGREAFAREEFESARQAMQDWEVLAMEERSLRESLSDRVAELEDQLNAQRELYERVAEERDGQNSTVDGLQRALHEIQEARKQELREMVEGSQAQLDALRSEAEASKAAATASAAELENTRKELERALPFEKEVKEKNLLIGKLRHEAVILNDHLTKALRFLKRGKPEDNVDRQIVTNHFLHFLMLDRSDPKKFQVLQLIAALLGWTEAQREQAGLARPGASNSALRVPLSPFRRTPSTPSLSSDFMPESTSGSKESLAELWSEFLEREAFEGGSSSRAASVAGHGIRSPSVPSITSPTSERQIPGLGINKQGPLS